MNVVLEMPESMTWDAGLHYSSAHPDSGFPGPRDSLLPGRYIWILMCQVSLLYFLCRRLQMALRNLLNVLVTQLSTFYDCLTLNWIYIQVVRVNEGTYGLGKNMSLQTQNIPHLRTVQRDCSPFRRNNTEKGRSRDVDSEGQVWSSALPSPK